MLVLHQVNNKYVISSIVALQNLGVFVVVDEGKEKRPALVAEQVLDQL